VTGARGTQEGAVDYADLPSFSCIHSMQDSVSMTRASFLLGRSQKHECISRGLGELYTKMYGSRRPLVAGFSPVKLGDILGTHQDLDYHWWWLSGLGLGKWEANRSPQRLAHPANQSPPLERLRSAHAFCRRHVAFGLRIFWRIRCEKEIRATCFTVCYVWEAFPSQNPTLDCFSDIRSL
jgi:hypothetical protein